MSRWKTLAVWGPVSTTLEYALADFALTRLAAPSAAPTIPRLPGKPTRGRTSSIPRPSSSARAAATARSCSPSIPIRWRAPPRNGTPVAPVTSREPRGTTRFSRPTRSRHTPCPGGPGLPGTPAVALRSKRFVAWNEPDLAFPYHFSHFAGEGWRTAPLVNDARRASSPRTGRAPGQRRCARSRPGMCSRRSASSPMSPSRRLRHGHSAVRPRHTHAARRRFHPQLTARLARAPIRERRAANRARRPPWNATSGVE